MPYNTYRPVNDLARGALVEITLDVDDAALIDAAARVEGVAPAELILAASARRAMVAILDDAAARMRAACTGR